MIEGRDEILGAHLRMVEHVLDRAHRRAGHTLAEELFSPRLPRRYSSLLTCMGLFLSSDCFWVFLTVLCSERERPFFVPSPAIRFPERAEGVKGPKR
jgi:hypothetical protein